MRKFVLWLDKTWARLLIASFACGIGLMITMSFLMDEFEKKTYEHRELELQRMTELSLNTINPIIQRYNRGFSSKEDTLREIRTEVRRMVFHDLYGYNYIFMSSYEGIMLVQPFEPLLEGTNQLGLRDAYGLPVIELLIKKAQEGGGFVTYYYHPPERSTVQKKISYVMPIPELGVYIGSGMYVDDIQTSNHKFFSNLFIVSLTAFAFILLVQYLTLRPMFKSYRTLTDAFAKLQFQFNPSMRVSDTKYHTGSEAQKLLTGFNQLMLVIEQKTEALRQNEIKFRTLFEYANEAIFILNNGVIVDCNYCTELLFGLSYQDIIGCSPEALSPIYQPDGQTSKQKARDIRKKLSLGKPCVFEWRYLREKCEFDAEVSLGLFSIEENDFLLAIARDISARKESEAKFQEVHEELLASYEELEKMNSELKNHEEQIRHLAYHDSLTGLPNRRLITELLYRELQKANATEITGAVLFLDLDNFKMINDSCGHAAGDEVLIIFARELMRVFGDEHPVARFGGDEFVVLLDGVASIDKVSWYAEQTMQATRKYINICGRRFQLSASIGIVLYPRDGTDVDEIFKNADTALYAVKNEGKDAWLYYDPVMQATLTQRLSLEQSLRDALINEGFTLHYQPIVNTSNGEVHGFEALLRWNSDNGVVSPLAFIPIAEESGLIVPMGKWVLKNACLFALKLIERGYTDVFVAVNISVKQLAHPDFVSTLRRILLEVGLPARNLELEITETVLMNSVEENVEKLMEIKNLGIKLALDDFGTGYSSLTYLRQLPIQILKIDKSFIYDIAGNERNSGMVESIIQLSHKLGIKVIAEGVETQEQKIRLKGYNCDMSQGYLISRPISADDVFTFLETN